MNKKVIIGYLVEAVLSSAILVLLLLTTDRKLLISFASIHARDFATFIVAPMFAASVGLIVALFSITNSDFGEWLIGKKALDVYLYAFGVGVAIYFFSTIALILVNPQFNEILIFSTLWLLIFAIINIYSLIKNTFDLIRLNAKFNAIKKTKK